MARRKRTESLAAFKKRMARETAKSVQKRALAELGKKIREAKARRKQALSRARELCKLSKQRTREQVKAYRQTERERVNATIEAMRAQVKDACATRRARIRKASRTEETKSRKLAAEQRRFNREMSRVDRSRAKEQAASERRMRKRRNEEDNDQVEANIEAELVPVFRAVAKQIKRSPRRTRTEAFLEWVQENPEEVLAIQQEQADAGVAELIREVEIQELEAMRDRLAKTKPRGGSTFTDNDLAALRVAGVDPFTTGETPF